MREDRLRFYKGDKCTNCSKDITIKNKSGLCRSCGKLGNTITLGFKLSEFRKRQLSEQRIGKNNPNWKGDTVSLSALHGWVKRYLKKSELCDNCKKVPSYDLANKGIYNRDFKNWEWLCRKCHMTKDGRLEKFRELAKGKA